MKSLFTYVFLACAAVSLATAGGGTVRLKLVAPSVVLAPEVQPVRDAKQKPFGTVISVAGRITVADEFGGPAYLQDATGGIAVYDTGLHAAAIAGDSVLVTGPYTEFGAGSEPGSGLGQISGQGTTWQIIDVPRAEPTPHPVVISDIGEAIEGELVKIEGVSIGGGTGAPRSFQQNKNYDITDATGTVQLRIDNTTNLVGAPIPEGNISIVGVVGQYMGTHQILPRTTDDLGIDVAPNPWDTLSKDKTFDITTWNLEWFGDAENGPENDSLQFRNVVRVLDSIDADLYGLQEVVSKQLFQRILDSLPRYRGLYSYEIGQPQKMAYLFKPSVVDSVSSAHVLKSQGSWGNGRYPLMFMFRADIGGETKTVHTFLIHAKATSDTPIDDYQQRKTDATTLYNYLNSVYRDNNVIVLGDFNDDVDISTYNDQESPYKAFVDNTQRYNIPTKRLSDRGASSYSKGASMLDHIMVSDELAPYVLPGAEKVENVSYIGSYISTTSDHYPVSARFELQAPVSAVEERTESEELRVYPSPVSDRATVEFSVEKSGLVRLEVAGTAGDIHVLYEAVLEPGQYVLPLVAPASAGVYFCRLHTNGETIVHRFVVVR